MDRISKLPEGIIETILCLLPIQEAARTSILSREWRYRWIKIPKLVFNEYKFQVSTDEPELSALEQLINKPNLRKEMAKRCILFYAIYQVLLMHEGPIHEFSLSMKVDYTCVEIDHILLHLSKKNTVKILKLDFIDYDRGYMLPISFFSLHQLTELHLIDCIISHESSFSAFGCLTTLKLETIRTDYKTLLRFLSSCSSLKRLTLNNRYIFFSSFGPIVDLFKCLPPIEYLSVWYDTFECSIFERHPKEPTTELVHLKCLRMEHMYFTYKYCLPYLFLMIKSSPNLDKLELVMEDLDWTGEDELDPSFTLEDYSYIMFEHLNELEVRYFSDAAFELDFVIFVLARSPVLKKVTVFTFRGFDEDEAAAISNILLCSPCASPMLKISVTKV